MNTGKSWMVPSTSRFAMCLLTATATGAAIVLAGGNPAATAAGKNKEPAAPPAQVSREQVVNQALGLTASQLISLEVDPTPDRNIWTPITIDGQQYTIDLEPHSIRAPGYQLRAQQADGSWIDVDPGPERTLRGSLEEVPGSRMAASLLEDGLHGLMIMPDGQRIWIEPLLNRVPGAAGNEYVLYHDTDVIHPEGTCGTKNDAAALLDLPPGIPGDQPGGGISGGVTYCAEIACDADFEYYVSKGSSVAAVQNAINAVLNTMDQQYLAQVDIDHVVTAILVRTAEPDPYSTTNAGSLLNQFRNEWLANQGGIPRDVAHLFTGKSIDGGTIGIAFLSGVCNSNGYSLVQSDCCGSFACATDLSAHELGHNWSAQHCNPQVNSTMNPVITCVNTFLGCNPDTVAQIVAYRNAVAAGCLTTCADQALPFSDTFPDFALDPAKWTTIVNCSGSTGATNEPSGPFSLDIRGGFSTSETQIRSARIITTGLPNLQMTFQYQQQGLLDDPEAGDDLVVEYFNNVGNWVEINRQFGSAPSLATFTPVLVTFPADAKHPDFRVRFRNTSAQINVDDWFVDDVLIQGSPPNDACAFAPSVPSGSHAFSTVAALTDGPDETGGCGIQIHNDVWYRFGAGCAPGTVKVSLCGATYDSRVAIYTQPCPGAPGALICNDNFCGDDAEVSLFVASPQNLRIRVGGTTAGATGTGTMVISCTPGGGTCPEDVNHDNFVNLADLLEVISLWNTNDPDADINNDNIVNLADLLLVIGAWGAC